MSLQDGSQVGGPDGGEGVVDAEESVTTGTEADLTQPQTTADLAALQQTEIGHATTITQHDLQSSALTDAFNTTALDQTFQQTLNQQVGWASLHSHLFKDLHDWSEL